VYVGGQLRARLNTIAWGTVSSPFRAPAFSRVENMDLSESCSIQSPSLPRAAIYQQLFAMLGTIYCRFFHSAISRPVGGKYRCWKCLREFELDW
jgi:hypothetical protein